MEEEDQFLAKESETLCRAPKSVLKGCLISYLEVKKIKNILQYRVLLLLCPSLGGVEILSHSFTVFTMTLFFLIWYFSKDLSTPLLVCFLFFVSRKGHPFHFAFSVRWKLQAFAFPF